MNAEDHNLNNVTDASTVREAFEDIVPYGSTPTAMALDDILREFAVLEASGLKLTSTSAIL